MRYALAYLVAAVTFLALDVCWLTFMGQRLYQSEIGQLLSKSVRPLPAVGFYLIYLFGVVFFAVRPALQSGQISTAVVQGAALGLVAYATYDLTCQATMAVWSTKVTVADLVWGAAATAVSAAVATAVALRVFGRA